MSAEILNIEKAFEVNGNKKVINTIKNFEILLHLHNITCRYNVISKRYEINIPGKELIGDTADDQARTCILSYMEEAGIPTKHIDNYISYMAARNQYNPVLDWIISKPWDGISRLGEFYETLTTEYPAERDALLFRWLVTCVAMAAQNGVDAAGCLVLQGGQDLGKTWWFRKLVPETECPNVVRTDASLDTKDRDSKMQLLRYWIVELGEIDSTFRRSDISALKAFITAKQDDLRLSYARHDIRLPRRTALCASVNPHYYLHDDTGNRRYWTIPVTAVNSYHTVNMQQLWAEVYMLYKEGEGWKLTEQEKKYLAIINSNHELPDPIFELLAEKYDWNSIYTAQWKTAVQIARDLEIKNVSQKETRIIASSIMKLCPKDIKCEKIVHGYRVFRVPALIK